MRIAFDNSIHLGQFGITDESARIAAKNSQAMISLKPESAVIGIEAFNENTYSDDIIWTLERAPQDKFYKFMDVYHSITNILRVPLTRENAELALRIHEELKINMANALTCAVAVIHQADAIHSIYGEMTDPSVVRYVRDQFGIVVTLPSANKEVSFPDAELESYYQDALATFRDNGIHLPLNFHP